MIENFSVLVPVYNFDVVPLVNQLLKVSQKSQLKFEILLIDDFSSDEFKKKNESLNFFCISLKLIFTLSNLLSFLRKIVENLLLLNRFFLALLVPTILLDLLLVSLNFVLLAGKFMQKNGLKNYRLN